MELGEVTTEELMEELMTRVDTGVIICARNTQIVNVSGNCETVITSRHKGGYLEVLGLCFAFQHRVANHGTKFQSDHYVDLDDIHLDDDYTDMEDED